MSEIQNNDHDKDLNENSLTESSDITEKAESEAPCTTPIDTAEVKISKKPKRVSLFTFVLTTVSLVLAAVMITYTVSAAMFKEKLNQAQLGNAIQGAEVNELSGKIDLISRFFDAYCFENTDSETMIAAALKAYVAATGDRYAYYYTDEEYADYKKEAVGESEGIGITILQREVDIRGSKYTVMRVANVIKGSPAEQSGLLMGDLIYAVGKGDASSTVNEMGFSDALAALKGKAGTFAEFTVYRPSEDKFIPMSVERKSIISESVIYRIYSEDAKVGIVRIIQFNLTTPTQFKAAMDDLISKGCTDFVLDLRDNPGGDLLSVEAVLSYFLKENDVMIRTSYKSGEEEIDRVAVTSHTGDYEGCSVSAEDIGRYRKDEYKYTVLCNGSTASAGELFTATFRDYELGTVVGVKTYGKGSMQRYFRLSQYGYSGVLKLTIAKYFSGANEGMNDGYDGIGITPHIICELSPEAAEKSIYELTDHDDDQLKKAIECFD